MDDEISTVPGTVALVFGILSIIGALVGVVAAFGGAFFSMCCAMFGWIGALVPLVAGVFSVISLAIGLAVRLRGAEGEDDSNPTYALIGMVLSGLALCVSGVSVVVAMWATIAGVIYMVIAVIASALGLV